MRLFVQILCASLLYTYPSEWWAPAPREGAPEWEILPQEAGPGEVILSKRTELGVFSNFAGTPFTYRGKTYASVEGFWQSTKYPEGSGDPRIREGIVWPHARAEVEAMTSFDAKRAGDAASRNMRELGIDWVSFEGRRMTYRAPGESEFYQLVREVMWEKLQQNPEVEVLLLRTGDLILRPDHNVSETDRALKAWRYDEIWMDFRSIIKERH